MTPDPRREAALALHRFGMGPRPGSIAAITSDPRGAVLAELERPLARPVPDLLTSAEASRAAFDDIAERRARQIVAQRVQQKAERARAMDMAGAGDAAPSATP